MRTKPSARIMSLTPKMAQKWLKKNDCNRPLNEGKILLFADQMSKGLWAFNGESISIADTGRMLNGQHRCHAVIKSGVTILVLVCFGVKEETFKTFDTGGIRTGADVLAINGFDNAIRKASICRAVMNWKRGNKRAFGYDFGSGNPGKSKSKTHIARTLPHTNSEILAFALSNKTKLNEVYGFVVDLYQKSRILSITQLALFYWMFSEGSLEKAQEFLRKLTLSENVCVDSVVAICRRRLEQNLSSSTQKLNQSSQAAYIIKTWNAFIGLKSFKVLTWNPEKEEFPKIVMAKAA